MRLDRTERFYVFRYPGASSRSSVPVDAQWEIRGGKFHNHRKQSAVSAVFAMICHVHHVPLMNMFLELGVFRTVADEDGQISLPADLETIAEKLGLQTEMR